MYYNIVIFRKKITEKVDNIKTGADLGGTRALWESEELAGQLHSSV